MLLVVGNQTSHLHEIAAGAFQNIAASLISRYFISDPPFIIRNRLNNDFACSMGVFVIAQNEAAHTTFTKAKTKL